MQAETDRREYRRQQDELARVERERQQTMGALKGQIREARRQYGDDSIEVATLSSQLDDLEQGVERDTNAAQTFAQVVTSERAKAAAITHKAAFGPLLEGLPDSELQDLSQWWKDHAEPDAQGQFKVAPDAALSQLAKRITEKRDEHIRQQTIDGLKDELDHDPALRAQLLHWIQGGEFEEPEHLVGGSPVGLPSDEQLDRMTPQQYAKLNLSPEAEKRLLTRPRRN